MNNGDVVCGTEEGDLTLWTIENGRFELIKIIPCLTDPIKCLELLTNGNVACHFDDSIQIWNLESDVMVHRLCDHTGYVFALFLLSNGHLASLSYDYTVTVWNVENGQRLKTFALGHLFELCPFIALPNEQVENN
jgi:WD40 repeat protein